MTQLQKIKRFFRKYTVANKLEACHFEQGANACLMGLSPAGLNKTQLAGYRAAMVVRREVAGQWGRP